MGLLQRFEDRLEEVVSGAFAKAFRSAVQPVEIAAALQRELDNSAQILSRDRRLAPNSFHVELSPLDFDRLGPYEQTLGAELTELLTEHAQEQHYVFTGPVSITFGRSDELGTGRFHVRSHAAALVETTSRPTPASGGQAPATVFLEVNGSRHQVPADGLVLGRGPEADLRISDPGVSRRHVQVRLSPGSGHPRVSVTDLGSTNGTLVDGERVAEAVVNDGTVVRLGNTTVTVRIGSAAPSGGEDLV